jgi:hypothetical protein
MIRWLGDDRRVIWNISIDFSIFIILFWVLLLDAVMRALGMGSIRLGLLFLGRFRPEIWVSCGILVIIYRGICCIRLELSHNGRAI